MSAVVLRTAAPSRANIAFPNGWSCVREAERTELEQKQRGWASACARGKREAGAHLRAFPQFVPHGILSYLGGLLCSAAEGEVSCVVVEPSPSTSAGAVVPSLESIGTTCCDAAGSTTAAGHTGG